MSRSTFLLLTTLITVNLAIAQKPSDLLPPPPVWSGKTRALAVAKTHPWATPWERSGLIDSPSYDVTMAWITRLVQQHDTLEMITIGKTLQGRDLVVVIASQEGAYSSKTLRGNGKPTLFVHAGIRPGLTLSQQQENDLLWIRAAFLDHVEPHPWTVVHGHTALDYPQHHGNRVNLDGGAGYGRPIYPAVFEGTDCWLLNANGRTALTA